MAKDANEQAPNDTAQLTVHFSKAPIVEAIINFNTRELASLTDVDRMSAAVSTQYPKREELFELRAEVSSDKGSPRLTTGEKQTGYQFRGTDEGNVFQARTNGYSFHRLHPYDTWDTFRSEGRRLWDMYRRLVAQAPIQVITVRYINRLEFPSGSELSAYLRTFPEVGKDLPQELSTYIMRLDLVVRDIPNGLLVLQQTLTPSTKPDSSTVMLDLDFRAPVQESTRDDEAWELVESIRPIKNKVFLNCITEAMKERIK